jgi:hypothetical protein
MRQRAERLAHVHHTHRPYNLPESGQKSAYKAHRDGVAERCTDLAVHKTIEGDLALIIYDDALRKALELSLWQTAKQHDAHTLSLVQTVPGLGKLLSLVCLYAIHAIARFASVQDCVSSCRLVTCAQESAGQRLGHIGQKNRAESSQGGLVRSGDVVPAPPCRRAALSSPLRETTWEGESLDDPGA